MEQAGGSVLAKWASISQFGVALGFTNNDGVSGLSAIVGYGIMIATLKRNGRYNGCGQHRTGVLGWYFSGWCCCLGIQPFLQNSTSRVPRFLRW